MYQELDCLVMKQSSRNSDDSGGGEVAFAISPFHGMQYQHFKVVQCLFHSGTCALCHTAWTFMPVCLLIRFS